MSFVLSFRGLPVDESGEIRLEHVGEPSFSISDYFVTEMVHGRGEQLFSRVVEGLSLKWYWRTSWAACTAENRLPIRSDCFEPQAIRVDLETIRTRLGELEPELPRRYRIRQSNRNDGWQASARVFHDGRSFTVSAGWDWCKAMCFREHPPFESLEPSERVRILLSDPVDVELDLRFENPFLCYEAVRDGAGMRPGDPIELHVSSEGPTEFFSPFLNGAIEFCLRAEAAGVAVFTRVG